MTTIHSPRNSARARCTLVVVCLGVLVIVVDSTSVVMALPQIKTELGFSEAGVAWVLNGFMITYAAFRLLGGRLGDMLGHRPLFLGGLVVFMVASLVGALAGTCEQLIVARAIQGVAGALIVTAALSLIVDIFRETGARAQAVAVYGFASAGGGAVGLLLGGVLTTLCGWRWIFLINLPSGMAIYLLSHILLPRTDTSPLPRSLDLPGVTAVTASLAIATYAILDGGESGVWTPRTVTLFAAAVLLMMAFVGIERRTSAPVLPLSVLRLPNLITCCVTNLLLSAAATAAVFASLYLQLISHYNALWASLSFLPLNLTMAVFSLGLSARLVSLFGARWPLAAGLLIMATGLVLLGRTSTEGSVAVEVLPGLGLLGLGNGVVLGPLLVAATGGVTKGDAGLASGVIGTSASVGRALGLAALASVATARTNSLLAAGLAPQVALNDGYHAAFFLGALWAALAAAYALVALRIRP